MDWYKYISDKTYVGTLDKQAAHIAYARAGSAGRTDVVDMYLAIEDNKIIDARFQVYGSAATIACVNFLVRTCINQSLDTVLHYSHQPIIDALALPSTAFSSTLLAIDALKQAIKDYQESK